MQLSGAAAMVAASVASLLAVGCPGALAAQQLRDLTTIPLEQLMTMEVTSAAKRPQKLSDATSAVFVITQEDIRRSGATNIPEALRLAPGLQVARIDANAWSITARGFASRFANKLLVLIDGRTVYTPLFSGVFWDRHDTIMEDIDRIEVIRGPGAALWGANAVNGVINVITKHSRDTQGALATATVGTSERREVGLRYGGAAGADTTYRAFAKDSEHGSWRTAAGTDGRDDWRYRRAGMRADGQWTENDSWMLDASGYTGQLGETFTSPQLTPPFSASLNGTTDVDGGYVLGRWTRSFDADSQLSLQAYYDRTSFDDLRLAESRDIADLELVHRFNIGSVNSIVWGVGYRFTQDSTRGSSNLSLTPADASASLVNIFAQDTIAILEDELHLTIGSKLEHNSYTDFEVQPTARLLWTVTPTDSVWTAVSRAVRTPSRAERDINLAGSVLPPGSALNPTPLPLQTTIFGSRGLVAETMTAFELGYRSQVSSNLSFDVAAFYNRYENLVTTEQGTPFVSLSPTPHTVLPFSLANKMSGRSYGAELLATWQPLDWWRLQGSYSFLSLDLRLNGDSLAPVTAEAPEKASPRHQFGLRSMMDLAPTLSLDAGARYVDALPTFGLPRYVELNLRLGWRPTPGLELALIGESLLRPRHAEFGSETLPIVPTRVERAILLQSVLRF